MKKETFYKKHELALNTGDAYVSTKYNYELLLQKWGENLVFHDENRPRNMVREIFWGVLSQSMTYYEPSIYDEKIALECGLVPFTYKGINLLALLIKGAEECTKNRLDQYQVLTSNTLDEKSLYFVENEREYFEYIVGEKVMNKINEILNKQEIL